MNMLPATAAEYEGMADQFDSRNFLQVSLLEPYSRQQQTALQLGYNSSL